MARKRNELGDTTNARIVALMRAGGTAESIYEQLRAEGVKKISRATIGRRMTELRSQVKSARAKAVAKSPTSTRGKVARPMPKTADEIPEDANVSELDDWLDKASRMADAAYADGDLEGFGKMGRLTSLLMEAKRKATPPKPPDPNERPDMLVAKENARKRFHELISKILPEAK